MWNDLNRPICSPKGNDDKLIMRGIVTAVLRGPDGKVKQWQVTHNIVTTQGDKFAAAAMYTGAYTGWGMKLGNSENAAAKSGAGSYIADGEYIDTSAQALDDGTPKANGDGVCQFRRLWAAGEGTDNTINAVAITDNTTNAYEADATHTFAYVKFAATIAKGANDTLTVTWDVTYLGA